MTTGIVRAWPGWTRLAAVAGYLVMVAAGLLLPVYTDEIGWRFQERAAVDHGVDIMFNDLCGPNSMGHPPWFMMPARWFSAIANQTFADPLAVRVEGVACALGWAVLLWALVVRAEPNHARRVRLHTLAFTLLGLGVLPLLLVMSRPEQPIMLTFTLMALIALAPPPAQRQALWAWIRCAAIALLLTIAASYHVKGVLYAPVALACLVFCANGPRTWLPRALGIGTAIAVALGAAHYWVEHLKCVAGNPLLAAHYARENVASLLTGPHPASGLIVQLVTGLNPFNYVVLAMASNVPMSHWLPDGLFAPAPLLIVDLGMLVVWLAAIGLAVRALVLFVRAQGFRALAQPRVPMALAIMGCVMIWGASQLKRNDYEAAHVLPMLVIFCVLCFSLPRPDPHDSRLPARLVGATAVFALVSQAIVLALVLPAMLAAAQMPGYLDKQPFSVSIGGYAKVRGDIARAMRMAGIPLDRPLHRLLIDDVTYLALQRTTLPLHRLGVLQVWDDGIDDPVDYLRRQDSDGVVVGCRYLPPDMRAQAAQSGGVCAISRAGLEHLDETSSPD